MVFESSERLVCAGSSRLVVFRIPTHRLLRTLPREDPPVLVPEFSHNFSAPWGLLRLARCPAQPTPSGTTDTLVLLTRLQVDYQLCRLIVRPTGYQLQIIEPPSSPRSKLLQGSDRRFCSLEPGEDGKMWRFRCYALPKNPRPPELAGSATPGMELSSSEFEIDMAESIGIYHAAHGRMHLDEGSGRLCIIWQNATGDVYGVAKGNWRNLVFSIGF